MITIQEIKEIRIHLKITQYELGYFLGYSRSFISKIELGKRSLDEQELLKVQDILDRLIISNRRSIHSAQMIMNKVKSRGDCLQVGTNSPKKHVSSGGELLK